MLSEPLDEHDQNPNAGPVDPTWVTNPSALDDRYHSCSTATALFFSTVYAPLRRASLRTLVTTPASLQAATNSSQLHHVVRKLDDAVDVAELVGLGHHRILSVAVLVQLVVMLKADRGAKVAKSIHQFLVELVP